MEDFAAYKISFSASVFLQDLRADLEAPSQQGQQEVNIIKCLGGKHATALCNTLVTLVVSWHRGLRFRAELHIRLGLRPCCNRIVVSILAARVASATTIRSQGNSLSTCLHEPQSCAAFANTTRLPELCR